MDEEDFSWNLSGELIDYALEKMETEEGLWDCYVDALKLANRIATEWYQRNHGVAVMGWVDTQ